MDPLGWAINGDISIKYKRAGLCVGVSRLLVSLDKARGGGSLSVGAVVAAVLRGGKRDLVRLEAFPACYGSW